MRRMGKKYFVIVGVCMGLVIWAFSLAGRLPDLNSPISISGQTYRNRGAEVSEQLSMLEREIESQKKESSALLEKIQAKFGSGSALEEGLMAAAGENASKLQALRHQLNQDVEQGEMKSQGEGVHAQPQAGRDENGAHEELEDPEHRDRETVMAVLVFVCNRPTVSRALDKLLHYRTSETRFPIVVTQDCGHDSPATQALSAYEDKITHIFQPDLSEIKVVPKQKKFLDYYKISRHYGWALNYTFNYLNYSNVIVVEDDLEIAPDFFEYFSATLGLLKKDPTLWCVSAWNDNGKPKRINGTASELLYRSDFFPGLGWMLTKELWNELSPKWPAGFWDDWMREPAQRKERACIRPEISRTSTFGKNGVSQGMYYLNHLRFIKLNDRFVPFSTLDLSYLLKDQYDVEFVRRVYSTKVVGSIAELTAQTEGVQGKEEFRLTYRTKADFRKIALQLEIMEDLKAGVPRTAYRGVVPFMFNNHRVYLAPGANWVGYQPN